MDVKTENSDWLQGVVFRIKQSQLTISADDISRLELSPSQKGCLRDIIKLSQKDEPPQPSTSAVKKLLSLGIREIEEINTAVEVIIASPDQKVSNRYVKNQFFLFPPAVAPAVPRVTFNNKFGLPPTFLNFTGRVAKLKQLEDNLEKERIITQKISGTGGVGKTQLALCFVLRQLEKYQSTKGKKGFCSVIWFIAGTDEGLNNQGLMMEQFQDLGEQLGIDPKTTKLPDLIRLTYKRLAEEHGPFIVVFDNAQNGRAIKSYLPPASVPIVITTRNNNERDFDLNFKTITLKIFKESEALAYIQKVLCLNHAHLFRVEEAELLAKTIRYPLGLTQALAYITNENMLIRNYLEEFTQQKAQYLQASLPMGEPYQEEKNPSEEKYLSLPKENYDALKATVWAVVQLSLKKVNHAYANQILMVCAYLAPEAPIDRALLALWTDTPQVCREAVAALRRYSLLEEVSKQDIAEHVRIHELVQQIVKLSDNGQEQVITLKKIADFMELHYEKEENPLADEKRRTALLIHILSILEYFKRLKIDLGKFKKQIAKLNLYVGSIYANQWNPKEAAMHLELALQTFEFLKDKDYEARSLFIQGNVFLQLEDAVDANKSLMRALKINEELFGSESSEVASVLVSLGGAVVGPFRSIIAKDYYKRALNIFLKSGRGLEYLEVRVVASNLAKLYLECGKPIKARKIFEEILPIEERAYGQDHIDVGNIKMGLGIAMDRLGEKNRALDLFQQAVNIFYRVCAPDHPILAASLMNLGIAILRQGDKKTTQAHFERALNIEKQFYGPEHPRVVETLASQGDEFLRCGHGSDACDLFEKALVIQESISTCDSKLGRILSGLGMAVLDLGDAKKAESHFKRALTIEEETCGLYAAQVVRTFTGLGRAKIELDDLGGAHFCLKKASYVQININQDCLEMAHIRFGQGLRFVKSGLADHALKPFTYCAQVFSDQLGEQHPYTIKAKTMLKQIQVNEESLPILVEDLQPKAVEKVSVSNKKTSDLDNAIQENNIERLYRYRDALLKKYSKLGITPTQLPKLVRACAQHRNVMGLKLLIHLGVAVDEPGPTTGQTALHLAVLKGYLECVKLLRAANADPYREDLNNQTPCSLSLDNPEMTAALNLGEKTDDKTAASIDNARIL